MKDYYKVLGVRKNASEEEIREHWVEWMRKLHPDQRIEGAEEDERIKEVNVAYQILKHSSTRVEYDLKRAYDHKKRGIYFQKLSVPIGIVIILIALATVYLKRPNITIEQALITQDQINKTDQIDQTDQKSVISDQGAVISYQKNQINQIDQTNDPNVLNDPNHPNVSRMATSTHEPNDPMTPKMERRNNPSSRRRIHASTDSRIDATMPKPEEASKPTTQLPNDSITQLPKDTVDQTPQRLNVLTAFIDERNQTNQRNQIDQINQNNPPTHQRIDASTHSRIDASSHPPTVAFTPLIATEEEVRRFFTNYTERYTQKDLDSFISLFSSRAVQNRQDGSEGIRKIYDNFLKQSQEIKYRMDNISVEIYQNGVEVKARYELVQIMKKSGEKRVWRGDIRWSLVKEDGALKILSLDYQHQNSP